MGETANNGVQTMGKRQKNALLDDGLCDVVDAFQKASGTTFPRIVTAALLQFFFDGLRNLEPGGSRSPDMFWMPLAMSLERAELDIGDLPTTVLDAIVQDAERSLRMHERGVWTDDDGETRNRIPRYDVVEIRPDSTADEDFSSPMPAAEEGGAA